MRVCATIISLFLLIAIANCKMLTEKENMELKKRCGGVAKGDLVEQDEYPFMATLRYRTADYVQMCGGSLISPYHVLTAAHCVMQFNITKLCNNTSEEKGTDAIYRTSRAVHLGSPNVGDPSKQTVVFLDESYLFSQRITSVKMAFFSNQTKFDSLEIERHIGETAH
ncbi:hypothetical protein Y032_0038g3555 [Ancylostoma ceylanicum]|uniref:Peptidase S1 domain-containing protein n=1 Tax=Ancylostoma ceylanicum TaxID=53326 RepID=A0A016UIH0_9BILA|nr:hypothetical protein Y032_0038g3555 [Ancylostoma ceylanicum]